MAIFNLNAKQKPLSDEQITNKRTENAGVTPEQQAVTEQFQRLPNYSKHIQTLMQGSSIPERAQSYSALMQEAQAAGIKVPEDMKLDMFGAVRDMTWAEKHPKLYVTLMVAGSVGGMGVGAAAANGAFAGGSALAGTAGGGAAAAGPTTAGSMAATSGALAGGTVPAALGGAGAMPAVAGAAGGASALSTALPYIKLGSEAVGGALQGQAQNNLSQRGLDIQQQQVNNQSKQFDANFARQNPGTQMSNSVRGDVLAGAQPASFSGSGRDLKLSGGLSPSLLSGDSRQLGALTARQALLAAMGQEDKDGNIGGVRNPYSLPKSGVR